MKKPAFGDWILQPLLDARRFNKKILGGRNNDHKRNERTNHGRLR